MSKVSCQNANLSRKSWEKRKVYEGEPSVSGSRGAVRHEMRDEMMMAFVRKRVRSSKIQEGLVGDI